MPNYVDNVIMLPKNSREKVLEFIGGEENPMDFEHIMPMPDTMRIESSNRQDKAVKMYINAIHPKGPVVKGVEKLSADEAERKAYAFFISSTIEDILVSKSELNKLYEDYGYDLSETGNYKNRKHCESMKEYASWGEKIIDNIEKYGCKDWYSWCVNNWGCKWPASDAYMESDNAFCMFTTPWSPPMGIYEAISKAFPDEIFITAYLDEDVSNNGIIVFENGEIIKEMELVTENRLNKYKNIESDDEEIEPEDYEKTDEDDDEDYDYDDFDDCSVFYESIEALCEFLLNIPDDELLDSLDEW